MDSARKSVDPGWSRTHCIPPPSSAARRPQGDAQPVSARLPVGAVGLGSRARCRLTDWRRVRQVKPPTMSRIVDALEADGLVRRRADAADARAVRLEATARGTKLLQEGRRRRVTRLTAAVRALDDDDLAILERAAAIIERLAAIVQAV